MRLWIVPEFHDVLVSIEHALHDTALNASPATVNEPHFVEPRRSGCMDVFLDDGRNVARGEWMQIEFGEDRNSRSHKSRLDS